jgi:hypothetical protein
MDSLAEAFDRIKNVFGGWGSQNMGENQKVEDSPSPNRIIDVSLLLVILGSIAILIIVLFGPNGLFG